MLNIAYVGFGKSTNRYHIPYVRQRPDKFHIGRVVAPHINKRPDDRLALEKTGTVFSTDIQDIIADKTVDLVIVVTPAPTHFTVVRQLLMAGKNVLVDKPVVATAQEATELIALANKNGLFFMPFQNRRFDSDFLTLKHVLNTGYVGRPIELELHMDHYRPNDAKSTGSAMETTWFDHGAHLVDQIVSLFGAPQAVAYDLRATRDLSATLSDQFEANLFYKDAFKATIQSSETTVTHYPKWILHGTKGSYIKHNIDQQEYDLKAGIMPGDVGFGQDAPQDYGKVTYYNQNNDRLEKFVPSILGDYGSVYDSVFETIVNKRPKLVSDEQLLTTMQILEAGIADVNPHIVNFNH
jgi:predicted dehydrogenase